MNCLHEWEGSHRLTDCKIWDRIMALKHDNKFVKGTNRDFHLPGCSFIYCLFT